VSKYLKWYDSYLDHTPTEDLAKNELESAHRKIKQLTESLAKANEQLQSVCNHNAMQQPEITRLRAELAKADERVRELEQENALLKEHKHDAYYAERNWNELHGDES